MLSAKLTMTSGHRCAWVLSSVDVSAQYVCGLHAVVRYGVTTPSRVKRFVMARLAEILCKKTQRPGSQRDDMQGAVLIFIL